MSVWFLIGDVGVGENVGGGSVWNVVYVLLF